MRQETIDAFLPFTDRYEGCLTYMYLDVLGLVTTGRGNLIDPMPAALALPWGRADGEAAEAHEISAEWTYVKSRTDLKLLGGGAFKGVTHLRLSQGAVDGLTLAVRDRMWADLTKRFAWLDAAPWEAQLATLSMAWALGPAFNFPRFQQAAARGDWATCAGQAGDANRFVSARGESWIKDDGNPGLRKRNLANKDLFAALG